jgi:hypothetical protein
MKLILYQKNSNKPIVLSDPENEETITNIEEIKKLMAPGKLAVFSTKEDFVIFRSSELAGIMVSTKDRNIRVDNPNIPNVKMTPTTKAPVVRRGPIPSGPEKKGGPELSPPPSSYEADLTITDGEEDNDA